MELFVFLIDPFFKCLLWSFFWSLALILGETKVELGTNDNGKDYMDIDVFNGPRRVPGWSNLEQCLNRMLTILEHILQHIGYMYGVFAYSWLI